MDLKKELDQLLKEVEKPGRYIGNEINSIIKDAADCEKPLCRFGFCFPDTYEIGMSYLGMQILYNVVNNKEELFCERAFCPAKDMENLMRQRGIPLFTLETKTPIADLDAVGFTLQYEMSFTNILNMLDLGGIPKLSAERGEDMPLIIAGGPCAYNPEPLADFIDVFLIGDGEETLPEFLLKLNSFKASGKSKKEFLKEVCNMEGVYVPAFYEVEYNADNTINKVIKLEETAPDRIKRSLIPDIEAVQFPVKPIVPLIEAVHDRAVVETFRGCTKGCRFCQAGMIYRPVRERKAETILDIAARQLDATGHDELSLLSLSTSDYSSFEKIATELMTVCREKDVSLSLPSLRLDSFSFNVLQEIQKYKKSGLTFAPEAGTQRLRDVINKGITEKNIYGAVEQALELGWKSIKLYFMMGLPTETYEDLDGIVEIAKNIVDLNYDINGKGGGRFKLTVSVSNFVPKAHTPFQWCSQNTKEEFRAKHSYLREKLKMRNVVFNYHETDTSALEAVVARGDRRVGQVLLKAYQLGCKFDAWTEHFKPELWDAAFKETGIAPEFYSQRVRSLDELLPWDIIDSAITKEFLQREYSKAIDEKTTCDCRIHCNNCGIKDRTQCAMEGVLNG